MTDGLMTIRQMCDAYDVTPRTLRFYESKELLSPIRQGQKRLYTHRDRGRLTLILRGKRFGFSLEAIRQLLDLYDGGRGREEQLVRTIETAQERLNEMKRERDELSNRISELEDQLDGGRRMLNDLRMPHAAE
jgi:DNA-binding transcriptional MerR regulator